MRAFEISLNGEKLCVAGIGDDGVLTATVNWIPRSGKGDLFLQTGGIVGQNNEHLQWIRQKPLKSDDEIQIRIVETTHVDEPQKRYRAELPRARQIGGIIGPY